MRYLRCILAFATSILLLLPGLSARPFPAQCDVLDKYSAVLDSVFPANGDQCTASRSLSGGPQITIRFLPSFSQESQVFICQVEPGRFFVVSSKLGPKDKTIWAHMMKSRQINEIASVSAPTTESSEEIAAVVHIVHKSCKLDSRVENDWFRRLAPVRMSLPLLGGGIDGTFYEVTLQNGMDLMQAKIWIESGQQKSLIALADNIRREIEKSQW